MGMHFVKSSDKGCWDFLQEWWGYQSNRKSGTSKKLDHSDVHSLSGEASLETWQWCYCQSSVVGYQIIALIQLVYNLNMSCTFKPHQIAENLGYSITVCSLQYFCQKHWTTQPDLGGELGIIWQVTLCQRLNGFNLDPSWLIFSFFKIFWLIHPI